MRAGLKSTTDLKLFLCKPRRRRQRLGEPPKAGEGVALPQGCESGPKAKPKGERGRSPLRTDNGALQRRIFLLERTVDLFAGISGGMAPYGG